MGRLAGFGSRTARGESRSQWTMKLLAQVRAVLRTKHYSPRTEESYVGWVRRFVRFHGLRHPAELGGAEVERFLSALAVEGRVSAATQNQAASALLFFYEHVIGTPLRSRGAVVRAKQLERLPIVLARDEARRVIAHLAGVNRLVGLLLYGSGLRLLEALELRVKDLDFERAEIRVRGAKGGRARVTMLAAMAAEPLGRHLAGCGGHMSSIERRGDGCRYRARWTARCRGRRSTGAGTGCFRGRGGTGMSGPVAECGPTGTSRPCSERCAKRRGTQA